MRVKRPRDKRIATAGYSKVYMRTNPNSVLTAIKVMTLENDNIDAIIKEVNTLRTLYHPNIVRMLNFEILRSKINIEMEYIKTDLMELVNTTYKKGLSFLSSVRYLKQLISAVSFLHDNGIIHLDIKPANILVNEEEGIIKLCDFNCVSYHANLNLENFGTSICKPIENFISLADEDLKLEIQTFSGVTKQSYTRKTDVYSLGILFLYLLTGKVLFFKDDNFISKPPSKYLRLFMLNPTVYVRDTISEAGYDCVHENKELILDFLMSIFKAKRVERANLSDVIRHPILNNDNHFILTKGKIIKQQILIPESGNLDLDEWSNYLNYALNLNIDVSYMVMASNLDMVIRLFVYNQINNRPFWKIEIDAINIISNIFFENFDYNSIEIDDIVYQIISKLSGFLFSDNPFFKVSNSEEAMMVLRSMNEITEYFNTDWSKQLTMKPGFNPEIKWNELMIKS